MNLRGEAVESLLIKDEYFVLNPLFNWELMKLFECGCDVLPGPGLGKDPDS